MRVYLRPDHRLGSVGEDSDDGLQVPHHHKLSSKSSSVARTGAWGQYVRPVLEMCLVALKQEFQNEREVEHPAVRAKLVGKGSLERVVS